MWKMSVRTGWDRAGRNADGSTGTYGDQKTPERGLVGRYDSDYGVSGVIPAKVRS